MDEVFDKLKSYPKRLAKYILEAVGEEEYEPSFLLEDEILFLEIINLCHAKSEVTPIQTDDHPSKE